ncbi:MAG: flagellar basal body protein FliL [Ignavibacteriae bacterium]|nr:flagellar basal body protein FliL [Ignavibacteriota bacterium]NOG97145.1 flagellar basal body protein FliL [Ignavibacteriota bacterium]
MPDEEKELNEKELDEKIEVVQPPSSSKINMKVFLFGLPVFILQLVFVYYITANILINRHEYGTEAATEKPETEDVEDSANVVELGKYIYSVDDIIVNPAGTDGKRLLLTSVGFDVVNEECMKELESKEILVKDMIISTLSEKSLSKLRNWNYKDSLRFEIAANMKNFMPGINVNKVYFSKFIIQ